VPSSRSTATRRWFAIAAAVGVPAAAVVLYWFPPTESSFYPRCLFHTLTALHCPGCGATRCLHALLHGDLRQAAAYNVLFLLILPFIFFNLVQTWAAALTGKRRKFRPSPSWSLALLSGIIMAFWILRNLSLPPFNLLAPHTL